MIVVIGIVSTITIVSYRGIKDRAVTVSYVSAVDQWEKLIRMEHLTTGKLPLTYDSVAGEYTRYCLGRATSDFPASGAYAAGQCADQITTVDGAQTASVKTFYNQTYIDLFQSKSSFPNGLLINSNKTAATSGNQTSSQTARGLNIYVSFVTGTQSYNVSIMWVPPTAGVCGRGIDYMPYLPAETTGGMCNLLFDLK